MEEPIRKEDIFDFDGTSKGLQDIISELDKLVKLLKTDLLQAVKDVVTEVQAANVATKEGQDKVKIAVQQVDILAAQKKEISKIEKESITLKERLNALESDEAKEVANLKVAIENKKKALKDAAREDDSAADSINRMRQNLKELTAEYNKLGPAARDQAAPAINKLSQELKTAEAAIGNNTRNVGNYKNSLLEAGKQVLSFVGLTGGATVVLGKLKDAFADTEAGINFFTRSGQAVKTFFQSIVQGDFQGATVKAAAAYEISKKLNEIRVIERKDLIEISKLEGDINLLRVKSVDDTISEKDKVDALNLAEKKENDLIALRLKDKNLELNAVQLLLTTRTDDTKLLDQQAALEAEIISIQADKSVRLASRAAAEREKLRKEELKNAELAGKEDADLQKALDLSTENSYKEYNAEVVKLDKDTHKKKEENLTGFAKMFNQIQNETVKVTEETSKEIGKIEDKDNAKRKRDEKELQNLKVEGLKEIEQSVETSLGVLSNLYQVQEQNELAAAGDNAAKKEEIERKYGKKQQAISIGEAVVNGAKGVTEIISKFAATPVIEAILIALTVAQTAAQIAIIKQQKYARGGSGVLQGPVHAYGGVNVGIGEAEGGEHVAVTSRAMTSRYGAKMLDAVSNSINQGKFFEVWGNVGKSFVSDEYGKKIYELMRADYKIYTDSDGNTVKEYNDGRKYVIKKHRKN